MKLFIFFSFVFLSAFVFEGSLPAQIDNDYWIVVPANYDPSYNNVPLLTLFAENPTNVTVRAANATYAVNANQAGQTIPNAMPMISQHKIILKKRAIHAYSLDGLPFHVQLALKPEEWGEGTWCIPTHSLGKMYRIVGYKASKDYIHPANYGPNPVVTPEFAIVATQDNTQVTIDFPPGKNLASINITMNTGDAYHVDCGKPDVKIDPTGTRVTASQPIAVFSGQANADIGGTDYGNALLEQMFPIESWGKLHNIVSDPLLSGDVYRFVADCDSTQISNDGTVVATIDAGKFYEVTISGGHEICSTKPIEVAKFTKGGNTLYGGEAGGPSMLVIPPVSCYFDSSRFYQVDIPAVSGGIGVPGVVVICPTAYITSVLFDGVGVPAAGFQAITNSCSPIQYSWTYASIPITTGGTHTLCYSTPPAANLYSLYGYYTAQDGDRDENLNWNVGYRSPKMPLALLEPGNLDFGTLICDTTKTLPIKISNVGNAPLVISSMSALTAPFTITGITLPDTIQPGDSVKGTVTFMSSTPGTYMQTLSLATNEVGICGPPVDTIHIEARKERAAITSAPPSHDFGNIACQDYDTQVSVTNVGTVDAQITTKIFSQPGIELISPSLPQILKPGEMKQFTIRLHGTQLAAGAYSSTLHFDAQPCNMNADFAFTANRVTLTYGITPNAVDFGITKVGKTRNSSVVFSNNNSIGVRIGEAHFNPSSFPGIITTPFPQRVAANGTLTIDFTATPPDTLPYQVNLIVTVDSSCPDQKSIPVSIEGATLCPQAEVTEVVGKVPGDVVTIPITITPSSKFVTTQTIDLVMKYDSKLLRSAGIPTSPVGTVSKVQPLPDGVSFTVTTPGTLPSGTSKIADLYLEALLAPYANGEFTVSTSTFTLQSGQQITGAPDCKTPFSLGSNCVKPSELQDRSGAVIEGIYPNPTEAGATIAINAYGTPHVRIDVFDTFGRKVETVADGLFTSGKHELSLDTDRYANGIYFCRMITGANTMTREFNIRK